jgi:hypothetical protein
MEAKHEKPALSVGQLWRGPVDWYGSGQARLLARFAAADQSFTPARQEPALRDRVDSTQTEHPSAETHGREAVLDERIPRDGASPAGICMN